FVLEVISCVADETPTNPESSKESELEPQIPLPPLVILQGASPSSEVMPLNYSEHSPRERSGLGIVKHTKHVIEDFSSNSVSGPVIVKDTEPVTTKVKNNEQESKINELTKLVQMLMDEKVNSFKKI
ncbi:hypothetical protein Tco_1567975, partial [Tanacetum coccineum]